MNPPGSESPVLDAHLQLVFLFEQVECDAAQDGLSLLIFCNDKAFCESVNQLDKPISLRRAIAL